MAVSDIQSDIMAIELAARGEEVRDAIVRALRHIAAQSGGAVDHDLSPDSENAVRNCAIYEALQGKQDTLTIDAQPAVDSENPVSSGGVFAALSGMQKEIRLASIRLKARWEGSGPYTQTVQMEGTTPRSKVDIQPDSNVFATLMADGVTALWIQNDNGTLTAYALGAAPAGEMTIQCTVTEV